MDEIAIEKIKKKGIDVNNRLNRIEKRLNNYSQSKNNNYCSNLSTDNFDISDNKFQREKVRNKSCYNILKNGKSLTSELNSMISITDNQFNSLENRKDFHNLLKPNGIHDECNDNNEFLEFNYPKSYRNDFKFKNESIPNSTFRRFNYDDDTFQSVNSKINTLFKEIDSLRDSKIQVKLLERELSETRKMIFIMKSQMEKHLSNFENLINSNLDLNIASTLDFNLIPDNSNILVNEKEKINDISNFITNKSNRNIENTIINKDKKSKKDSKNDKIEKVENKTINSHPYEIMKNEPHSRAKRDEIIKNLQVETSNNSVNIKDIIEKIIKLEDYLNLENKEINNNKVAFREKTETFDNYMKKSEKKIKILENNISTIQEKINKSSEINNESNHNMEVKINSLENKFNEKLRKIEDSNANEMSLAEEKFNETLNNSKIIIEEKMAKSTKKELELLKNTILTEVKDNIWEKKKSEMVKEIDRSISNVENKILKGLDENVDYLKSNLNELEKKLETDLNEEKRDIKELEKNLTNLTKVVERINDPYNNQYVLPINDLTELKLVGYKGSTQNLTKINSNYKKENNKSIVQKSDRKMNEILKLKNEKISDYILEDSEEEDQLVSLTENNLNESIKNKNIFNRFSHID